MRAHITSLAALAALAVTGSGFLAQAAQASRLPSTARPQSTIVLHNQNNDASGFGNVSQKFDTAHASDNSQGADDFTVPSGKTWTITEVDVTGFYSTSSGGAGGGPATSENVIFYKNTVNSKHQNVPGAKVKSVTLKGTDTSGKFVISGITGVKLAAGHYWVSVQANMSFSTGLWLWESRTVQSGSPAV